MRRRWIAAAIAAALMSAVLGGMSATRHEAAATTWPVRIMSVNTPAERVGTVLADPYVAGVSSRFTWAALEPSAGAFRWSKVDQVVAQARAAGKTAMIRVIAGIYTPGWVMGQVRTLTFSDRYLYNPANYPSQVTMPVPWDARYLQLWDRFVAALGDRYDGAAGVYAVAMSGGGFIGEMTLPTDVAKWRNAGYTDERYVGAWRTIIDSYRRAFVTTPFTLGITEPFGSAMTTNVVSPTVAYATQSTPRAWIQSNALRASALGNLGPYRTAIRNVNGITGVGYQMIGDAPTTQFLRDSFTVALQDGADFVEVYAADILASANRSTIRYLATGGQS